MSNQNPITAIYNPDEDGITHINIWLHAKTELGRELCHFYEMPFIHPVFGPFNSMEGLWQYVQAKESDSKIESERMSAESLRYLSGMTAKRSGKKLTWRHVDKFHEIINAANFYKIEQNSELKRMFVESNLPFAYYYVHKPPSKEFQCLIPRIINPEGYGWVVQGFEDNRKLMNDGKEPLTDIYEQFMVYTEANNLVK